MHELSQAELHAAVRDPVLNIPVFHTQVMSRFPDAVSFAPGAPNLAFLKEFRVTQYLDSYLQHRCQERGISRTRAEQALYEYGPSRGLIGDLIAQALRRDTGIEVAPEAVVVTVGAQEGMLLILRTLFHDNRDVLAVVNPCFIGITGAARLLDIEVVPVDEQDNRIDIAQLGEVCRRVAAQGRRVRALYVSPDYSNPSGTMLGEAARHDLLEAAAAHDLLLIEDGTYGFTAAMDDQLPSLKALDKDGRVVALGTFAKICFPGARVGYLLADQHVRTAEGNLRLLADEIAVVKGMVTLNTSSISQAVVGGMLLDHGTSLTDLGRQKAELYRRNLNLLLEALDRYLGEAGDTPAGVSWNRPAGGFFVRMRLPVKADAALLEISAGKFGVLWTPMSQFFLDGAGTDQIRLSCSYLEPDQIDDGVRRLARFLRSLTPGRSQ